MTDVLEELAGLAGFYGAHVVLGEPLERAVAEIRRLRAERQDTRDAIRLVIGRRTGIPWTSIGDGEVDSWIAEIRRLKAESDPPEEPKPEQ